MKILITIVALFFCVNLSNASNNSSLNLVVWAKDGTKVAYALSEAPKILFSETTLSIEVKNAKINYETNDIANLTYELIENSAITNVISDNELFDINDDYINVSAQNVECRITVFNIKGDIVQSMIVPKNYDYAFSVSDLERGVYIISINGQTCKIVRK